MTLTKYFNRRFLIISLLSGIAFSNLHAQEPEQEEATGEEPADDEYGLKFTAIPLPSYNSDDGFGLGLRVYATNYAPEMAPYDYQIYGQLYRTTKGYEYHVVSLDSLNFMGTPLRVKTKAGFERTLNAQYYGYGNYHDISHQKPVVNGDIPTTENQPKYPDIYRSEEFSLSTAYLTDPSSADALTPGQRVYRERQNKYYNYDRIRPFWETSTENFIGDTNFKGFAGMKFSSYKIQTYMGDREGGEAEMNSPTLIDIDRPTGYDATEKARFLNVAQAAIAYDSRPRLREKDPNEGIFTDLYVEGAGKGTGSNYSYTKASVTFRHYIELLPSFFNGFGKEVVFAYRVMGQETFGDVPFFEAGYLVNMNPSELNEGLAANRGLRGYPANQFIDDVMVLGNAELRMKFASISALGGMDFMLVTYYDVGRVGHEKSDITMKGWHKAYGGGLRMVWQRNTIVNISYGRSDTGGVNANFSFEHPF